MNGAWRRLVTAIRGRPAASVVIVAVVVSVVATGTTAAVSSQAVTTSVDEELTSTATGSGSAVEQPLPNAIVIHHSVPGRTGFYRFRVSGRLVGGADTGPANVVGHAARGSVGPQRGVDTYFYSGDITNFHLNGPATIVVNGRQIDPDVIATDRSHTVTVEHAGRDVVGRYRFSVDGDLVPGWQASPGSIGDSTAAGQVGPFRGVADYHYTGRITAFDLDGSARVRLDGRPVRPVEFPISTPNTLVVRHAVPGETGRYGFLVSGHLVGDDDTVAANVLADTGFGVVGPRRGVSTYHFSGIITDFRLDGPAIVVLNGRRVDPETLVGAGGGGTIPGDGGPPEGPDMPTVAPKIEPDERVVDDTGRTGPALYAVDLPAGITVRVVGMAVPDADVTLSGPDGAPLAVGNFGIDVTAVGTTIHRTGSYLLSVDGDFSNYAFQVQTTTPDPFEPSDGPSTAVPVDPGQSVDGTVTSGDEDWFAVDVPSGTALEATLERRNIAVDVGNDVGIAILAADGTSVGTVAPGRPLPSSETRRSPVSKVETAIQRTDRLSAGTYYVRVYGVSVGGFSEYRLSVSFTRSGPAGREDDE